MDLGFNGFHGRFPSVIGRLENLEFLSVPSNQFSGPLPTEITLLNKLKTLNLASNHFSGTIPDFSTMDNLTYLYLEGNQFEGMS
jgi:Leucine-rich repeat (LRR) protein